MKQEQCAAIVLAAGTSQRLGRPKQLVQMAGETLLQRAIRTAQEAGCAPVLVVLGAAYLQVLASGSLGSSIPVIHEGWQEGMASSIRAGVGALGALPIQVSGVVLMVCDQPAVTAEHLRRLCMSRGMAASTYAARNGVPAYFPASSLGTLVNLTGDAGARDLLRNAESVDLPGGELDIDTEADLLMAERWFGSTDAAGRRVALGER